MTSLFETPVDFEAAFRNFWKITMDLPHIGVMVGDVAGNHLFSNRTFRSMFYADADFDPTGKTIEELEGPDVARERMQLVHQVIETGRPLIVQHTRLGVRIESVLNPWKPNRAEGSPRHVLVFSRSSCPTDPATANVDAFESEFNSWGELDELTDRQLQVLATLRQGCSQKEAAKVLGVTPKTIETHRDQLIRRLGLSSTLDAIRLADRAGLTLETAQKSRLRDRPWEKFRVAPELPVAPQGVA